MIASQIFLSAISSLIVEAKLKIFGFSGSISPAAMISGLNESWEQDGITFSIKDGVLEANFPNERDRKRALDLARLHVQAWRFAHGARLSVAFNHSWRPESDGSVNHDLSLSDSIKVSERSKVKILHTVSSERRVRIVGKSDSASFAANRLLVEKSLEDKSLREALTFYAEEVVDEKRPLYGIYKALEVLINQLKAGGGEKYGRDALGKLAGKNGKYVDQVMERAQLQRHAAPRVRNILSEQECRSRAKELITAYADAISTSLLEVKRAK